MKSEYEPVLGVLRKVAITLALAASASAQMRLPYDRGNRPDDIRDCGNLLDDIRVGHSPTSGHFHPGALLGQFGNAGTLHPLPELELELRAIHEPAYDQPAAKRILRVRGGLPGKSATIHMAAAAVRAPRLPHGGVLIRGVFDAAGVFELELPAELSTSGLVARAVEFDGRRVGVGLALDKIEDEVRMRAGGRRAAKDWVMRTPRAH